MTDDKGDVRVFLVEDNEDHVEIRTEVLGSSGLRVSAYMTVSSAVKALDEVEFDIALIDLTLPDGDGLEGLDAIRERGTEAPVVFVSGHDDPRTSLEVMQRGVDDYVIKTFDYYSRLKDMILDQLSDD